MNAGKLQVISGDTRTALRQLPANSVQCCVTSPPYWGLRRYLPEGHPLAAFEIGQEKTPQLFVKTMVKVFRQVWRVLRDDGTCFVNLGDSYAGGGNGGGGLKPKDLAGIPWRVALALQADGWYLRQDIIWHKLNPMPESVTDRCTKSHEYIFLLTKSERYYYDADAIREPGLDHEDDIRRQLQQSENAKSHPTEERNGIRVRRSDDLKNYGMGVKGQEGLYGPRTTHPGGRNKRSVWSIPTFAYPDAHFATFPPDLIKPCIMAGSRPGDTVLDPFGGSGTTGEVSNGLGRNAILVELNPEYLPLIAARTNVTPGLCL